MPALRRRVVTVAVLSILLAPAVLRADEPEPAGPRADTVVIAGEDGHSLRLTLDGPELTIVTEDEDGTTTRIVDMEQIGMLVRGGLEEAVAALRDAQLDVHVGRDNRLDISHGDQTFEVDVDTILGQVREALRGVDALDAEDWSSVRQRDLSDEELREQLRELKREVRRLRQKLEEREL